MNNTIIVRETPNLETDHCEKHALEIINWETYPYRPEVKFSITHQNECLYIHFNVIENYPVKADYKTDQSPVYEDSCVEFFISPNNKEYYNFEINALGTLLSYKGKDRYNRIPLKTEELKQIKRETYAIDYHHERYHWQLSLGIPFDIIGITRGQCYKANFYKCGDKTACKHYVSYSRIKTQQPDFHQPKSFVTIEIT